MKTSSSKESLMKNWIVSFKKNSKICKRKSRTNKCSNPFLSLVVLFSNKTKIKTAHLDVLDLSTLDDIFFGDVVESVNEVDLMTSCHLRFTILSKKQDPWSPWQPSQQPNHRWSEPREIFLADRNIHRRWPKEAQCRSRRRHRQRRWGNSQQQWSWCTTRHRYRLCIRKGQEGVLLMTFSPSVT